MSSHVVCKTTELPPGSRRIVDVDGRSIGIFNMNGDYYALRNACVHNQGPVCVGRVGGTYLPSEPDEYNPGLEGRVLRCPWHGWEYDITTGENLIDRKLKLRSYPVTIEDGNVVLEA